MPAAKLFRLAEQLQASRTTIPRKPKYTKFIKGKNEMKKDLKGKVGTSVARNISKREGWEKGSDGTPAEKSRTHGNTLINDKAKTSDQTPTLTAFEANSGH